MGLLNEENQILEQPDEGSGNIELCFQPKDAQGNPVGPMKTVSGDGFKVWRAWMNGNGPGHKKGDKKRRQTKGRNVVLPKGSEADTLVKEAAKYAEKVKAERLVKDN